MVMNMKTVERCLKFENFHLLVCCETSYNIVQVYVFSHFQIKFSQYSYNYLNSGLLKCKYIAEKEKKIYQYGKISNCTSPTFKELNLQNSVIQIIFLSSNKLPF